MGFHINLVGRDVKAMEPHSYARGVAFTESNASKPESLLEYFARTETVGDFRMSVASLNGYFAVVLKRGSTLFAAVDRARSIPLFYGSAGDEFYISDDANWVQSKVGSFERSELAEYEFCMTGYVTDSDTLYPGVKQLRAGELLVAITLGSHVRFNVERYYDFTNTKEYYVSDAKELSNQFDRVLIRCFERLIALADGRRIVVPLSGGWDSRLIVLMLTRLGYSNISAFTYGRPGNLESEISKQVADALSIEWRFLPYSNESWREWFQSEERAAYYAMAHNAVSLPHIQDWPAVWELKRRKLIPEDSIFVPGHTGDFLAGTTGLPKTFFNTENIPRERVVDEIFREHYALFQFGSEESFIKKAMQQRISNQLGVSCDLTPESAFEVYKKWVWQERQAKFIVNSVRVYEFWGYDWWIPLGDSDMRDFWVHVTMDSRIDKRLYVAHIQQLAMHMVGTGNRAFYGTERDTMSARIKEAAKQTPLKDAGTWLYRKLKRETEYENHPMAWYGIMPKEVFRKYYHKGYVGLNTYLAPHTIGVIDWSW